ncbi:MAG: type IV pilus biogenesis/stability protein PilW [Bacteroidota bacterium]
MNNFSPRKLIVGCCLGVLCASAVLAQSLDPSDANRSQTSGDPKNRARIHTELGAMYFQNGHMSAALDEFRKALNADSDYVQAYSIRGLVYGQLKEYDRAESDFRRALSISPNDPEVNNNYGWYLCDTGKERQSIPYFLQALKNPLYETPDRAYTNAGTCALKAGDLEGAQNYLLNAIRLSRDGGAAARLQLAQVFYRRGINEEARIYLNEALKQIEPATPEALWLGLRIERKLGNRAGENAYASQLRSRYPTSQEYQEFLKGNFQ